MMIHLPMLIAYGLIGAWLLHRFDWAGGLMIGAGLGLAIYIVNFYGIAPAAFPCFLMGRNWIGTFSHIMFGAVVGVAYIVLRKPKLTGRSAGAARRRRSESERSLWPMLPRAGRSPLGGNRGRRLRQRDGGELFRHA